MRKIQNVADFTSEMDEIFFLLKEDSIDGDKATTMVRAADRSLRGHLGQMQYYSGTDVVLPFWEKKTESTPA